MFYFGMAKVIPAQFPPPSLVTLLRPVGSLAPDDMLWTFMGASLPYQRFAGCAEVLAGVLLVIPRTALLGALVASVDMVQVFALNMSYDVGLKQISFHLMFISFFLLSPEIGRIKRALTPDSRRPASRPAIALQVAFGLYLLLMFTRLSILSWHNPGGAGEPKSALYGVWDVERMSVDGVATPALFNDSDWRWRRLIFDTPGLVVFEYLDESFAYYEALIDSAGHHITLQNVHSQPHATLTFDRHGDTDMSLDGEMNEHRIHVDLRRLATNTLSLTNRSFRWIRPVS
jgi:uncharacterized membrane protein YphA (DoxX/SURF4 family)